MKVTILFVFGGLLFCAICGLAFYMQFQTWLYDITLPDKFPEDDAEEMRSFLVLIKKVKIFSWLGAALGVGHRVDELNKYFAYYFSSSGPVEDPSDDNVTVTYETFNGVEVRLYKPKSTVVGLRRGMVYLHGGGWTLGSAAEMDHVTRTLAVKCNMVVASVNYRLAPEYLFPIPFEDCVTATKHFLIHSLNYGVNPDRICVAGDSAGGNLAAAVALKLRDDHFSPQLASQLLVYPALQAIDFNLPSYQKFADDPYLDRDWTISFWLWYAFGNNRDFREYVFNQHTSLEAKIRYSAYLDWNYLPQIEDGVTEHDLVEGNQKTWDQIKDIFADRYFSPLLAESLEGLPDTYLVTCEQDVVRDEALLYKHRLITAGVKVNHDHYYALHALLDNMDIKYGRLALDKIGDYILANI